MLKKLFMNVHAGSGQSFASTDRHDPYKNFNFRVEITGRKTFVRAGFRTISGLMGKTDVVEYRDGDDRQLTPHKSPGLVKYDPVTFERGMSEDTDIMDWFLQQVRGNPNDDGHKVTIKIELLDRGRQAVKTWELREAWLADYETGEFNAEGNEVIIDRMSVQHEGIWFSSGGANAGGDVL